MRFSSTTSSLALALALVASPAYAQSQPTPPAGTPESSQQDDDATASPQQDSDTTATAAETAAPLETGDGENEIVVTGSRIARPEFSAPNPIQSFTTESLEQSGETNITDFLVDTPALVGSSTSADTSGSNGYFESAGLNLLNLRNLGTGRTLVLLNGRRHVAAYPGTASVDINTIPSDLIDRIDILTGGTSAIYGADGVSGVVNFVLKRNFEGLRLRGQTGISRYGDASNQLASVVYGRNFAADRGNIAVAYEYNRSDRLNDKDRPFTGDPLKRFELLRVRPPVDRPDDPNVYDRVLYNDIRWADSAPNGAVDIGSDDSDCEGAAGEFVFGCLDGIPDFTGSGQIYDRGLLIPSSGGRTIGGSSTPTAGYFGDFLPYLKRHNVNVLSSFEFSRAARLFVEGKWVDTDAFTVSQPTYDFFTRLAPDNAYLIQRFGADAAVGGALVSRDNLDFGIRGDRSDRQTLRGVIGLDGKITDHLRYEASFTYGRVNNATTSVNDRYADRYYAALDAVVGPNGQITCRINLPGETVIDENNYGEAPTTFNKGDCKPLTLLGQANSEGLAFVLATHTSKSRLTQEVASGYLAGDFGKFFDLPGGPIGFALGAEYRKEGSSQTPSKEFQQGLLLDSAEIEPAGGSFDVKEAFAELNVPLLKDLPFAKELSFGGAVRFSDYSTVGNTTTWKVDGIYAPVRDATFRGTYSKAVRAPNISELFDPLSGTFAFITDPCDFNNVTSGSQFRQANCTAQLSALGLTSAEIAAFNPANDAEASTSQPGQVGGNPNLGAENARTWTAGVVLRPRFLRGLTVSADYYDIKLKNAVNYASVSELFALCVDQPTLNNQYCNLIQRNPDTGFAGGFTQTPQNVAAFTTRGLDLQMNYRFSPSAQIGTFNVKIVGGWLRDLTFISTPGADLDQDRGEAYSPRYIGVADLTWTKGPLTLNYGLAYQSRTLRFTPEQLRANPDIADPKYIYYRERWEHDIQAQFAVDRDKFTFSAGVNNLFDSKPDVSSGGNYPYGAVGRYFYVGVKAKVF